MEIRDARVVVLGGSGLVGMAICRDLLAHRPAALVVSALSEAEAREGVEALLPLADPGIEIVPEWGNLFAPTALREARREHMMEDPASRAALLDALYGPLGEDSLRGSTLGDLILRHRPHVVVDCVNTATGFAYQNVFRSAADLRAAIADGTLTPELVERHLMTLYVPHLIHHVWVALHAMQQARTRVYVKVGTAGSGGMGLNIPFTHSEDRPSRPLLAKSAVAGAHTLLLYLMARTPGAPAVKEVKPTAAISWKRIGHGEVRRGRRPIARFDAVEALPLDAAFPAPNGNGRVHLPEGTWRPVDGALTGVFLDAGENGLFSPGEFEALTALGLMEFITPEEIARDVVREILGHPTGRDVVAALDAATSGPTYRAGVLRHSALSHMDALEAETGERGVAYENLGPPRLAKLLFEAELLRRLADGSLDAAAALDPADAAARAEALVREDADLRTRMVSIGLPVLLPDGRRVLRGPEVRVAPEDGRWETAVKNGWVDLRPANWARWRERLARMVAEVDRHAGAEGGSTWDMEPWQRERTLRPGALAAWIFRYEDAGERIKR